MEEAVEAAATLIGYLGDAVLRPKCWEVLALVAGVEEAADNVGVDRHDFTRAARDLEASGEGECVSNVLKLGDASAALEAVAQARIDILHSSAVKVTLACYEFQEAAEARKKLSYPKVGPLQERNGHHSWFAILLSLLGMRRLRRNHLGDIETGHQRQETIVDDLALITPLLREGTWMREKANAAVGQARKLFEASKGTTLDCSHLSNIELLHSMEDKDMPDFIIKLAAEATTFEADMTGSLNVLRNLAADLTRKCGELKQVAEAMATVQRVAAQQRERRAGGSWWSRLWRGSRREALGARDNPEQFQLQSRKQEDKRQEIVGDNDQGSICLAMQNCGLFGSLGILPYLGGPGGILKSNSSCYQSWAGSAFAWPWLAVGAGIPCLMVRCRWHHLVARLLARIGMLAVTLIVIFHCHWSLAPNWTVQLWLLVGLAVAVHVLLFFLACRAGDV